MQPSATAVEFPPELLQFELQPLSRCSAPPTASKLEFIAHFQPKSTVWSNSGKFWIPLSNDFRLPHAEMEATEKHKGKTIVTVASTGTIPLFPVLGEARATPKIRLQRVSRMASYPTPRIMQAFAISPVIAFGTSRDKQTNVVPAPLRGHRRASPALSSADVQAKRTLFHLSSNDP